MTGKTIGIELLVRWVNHLGKSIEPHFFLPLIRNSKYKAKFSQWVLEETFRVSEALSIEGFNGRVACNLDASEMYSGIEFFLHKLRKEYPNAGEVEIEVTEVGQLGDRRNLEAYIECFKSHGIKVTWFNRFTHPVKR
ncbi:EAL domain-containing protein [Alteromonas sp. CNT1-28]|nr:EAL domain-containing protein [Alteromonas sp. CNT1-28]